MYIWINICIYNIYLSIDPSIHPSISLSLSSDRLRFGLGLRSRIAELDGINGLCWSESHGIWIDLREKLQEASYFIGKSMVSGRFSLKPIHWSWDMNAMIWLGCWCWCLWYITGIHGDIYPGSHEIEPGSTLLAPGDHHPKKKKLKNASNWGSGMISVVSIPKFQYIYMLVGGWAYPSEKYEFVSRDDGIHTNLWKVIKIMFQTTNQYISWIKNSIKPNHPWVIPMISPCHISDGESGGAFLDQHESRLMTYVP